VQPERPPPPNWGRQCYSPTWACGWSISPVFHDFCTRWSCEFMSHISHFTPPGMIPQWSLDRTLVSHNAAPVWTWWWELSFPSGNSATVNTVVRCGLVHNTVWGIGLRHSLRQAYFLKTSVGISWGYSDHMSCVVNWRLSLVEVYVRRSVADVTWNNVHNQCFI